MLEKGLIVNSLLKDIPTASKKNTEGEGGLAGFLVHVSKSNIYITLKEPYRNLRLQLGFKYDATSVQVTRVLVVIV